MGKFNRWVYASVGVIVLLLAGLVYAWSVIGKSIGAVYPEWTKAQLSLTFTIVMIFFCFGSKVTLLCAFECLSILGRLHGISCFAQTNWIAGVG